MASETELKLALPETAQSRFLRHPVLRRAVTRQTRQLVNLYYDTPALALHRHGIALRLRKQGPLWLQTVKCSGVSSAGLSTRPEWESSYVGYFDFSAVDDLAARRRLSKLQKSIVPLFETNFRRTTWRFEPRPGCVLLLALDRGWIAAEGRREPISEVEIELVCPADRENVMALFELARTLGENLPLVPEILSKAERGYRLFLGQILTPRKAFDIALAADTPLHEAFRRIVIECLEHLQGNHAGALCGEEPEFVHQMRVASRRLRAALRLFAPHLPEDFVAALLSPLGDLMSGLGQSRDLDVLQVEIVAPVVHALPGEPRLAALAGAVTNRQYAARSAALHMLESPAYGRFLLQTMALLHLPPFTTESGMVAEAVLVDHVKARLRRLFRKLGTLVADIDTDDPASLHRLRIGVKRLRYALEFFASLAERKPLSHLLQALTVLQDELGQINDLSNAGRLLMECAGDDPRLCEAVSLIGFWHTARYRALLAGIVQRAGKLQKLRLPRLLHGH